MFEVAIKLHLLAVALVLGWFGPALLDAMQRRGIQ